MALQALEQVFNTTATISENNLYTRIDTYKAGTTVLYAPFEPIIKPLTDRPGQITERYGPLVERIDASHGDLHLNYDLFGVKKRDQRKLFSDGYDDFHRREL